MNRIKDRQQQAKVIRWARKLHRYSGIFLFIFFFVVGITSILLGWKKDSGGYLLPDTAKGTSSNLEEWLPVEELHKIALHSLHDTLGSEEIFAVDRMEIRKNDGVVKVSFKNSYHGLQLDGATGKLLQFGPRRSDFIEDLHDGSILDDLLETDSNIFTLLYSTILGAALLLFTMTGIWLWYGPKRMKKRQAS
jgi:hypothetical protein